MIERVSGVDVVHWNPRRNSLPYPLRRLPIGARVNNFGDLLGPMIVNRLVGSRVGVAAYSTARSTRLLSVGSILGLAKDGDVVWGTGVNGKASEESHRFTRLDVRAVRGPKTAQLLLRRGIACPDIYGDPALLVPRLFPEWVSPGSDKKRKVGMVPNLHDFAESAHLPDVVSPIGSPVRIIKYIQESEKVIASSLHGVIIAEALGIPCALVASKTEPPFKYEDYFEGTGRAGMSIYTDVTAALEALQRKAVAPLGDSWDSNALMGAFPEELWRA